MDFHPWIGWTALVLVALALVLVAVRLLGVITWSWWFVLAPLYPIVALLCVVILAFIAMAADGMNGNWH